MPLDEAMPADQSLLAVLDQLAARGIDGQLRAVDSGEVQCLTCRRTFPAPEWDVLTLTRLEGVSDPADMLAVVAMRCPACATAGVLTAHYGAEASVEEAEALIALERHAATEPPEVVAPGTADADPALDAPALDLPADGTADPPTSPDRSARQPPTEA